MLHRRLVDQGKKLLHNTGGIPCKCCHHFLFSELTRNIFFQHLAEIIEEMAIVIIGKEE